MAKKRKSTQLTLGITTKQKKPWALIRAQPNPYQDQWDLIEKKGRPVTRNDIEKQYVR